MNFVALQSSAIAILYPTENPSANRNQFYSVKGDFVGKACAFGNLATPIADKTINVPANGLLFLSTACQIGIADTIPPVLTIKKGSTVFCRVGMSFFPECFCIHGLPADTYTISVDMIGIIDGGCGYTAYSIIGETY